MAITMNFNPREVKLTDFMKTLGYEHPHAADGNLRIYPAPYTEDHRPTMVINVETNLWRDTESGAYGGIYDLVYELTGTANRSEMNMYIATEMSALQHVSLRHETDPKPEPPAQPRRKMRF